jgi:hypothetical protein
MAEMEMVWLTLEDSDLNLFQQPEVTGSRLNLVAPWHPSGRIAFNVFGVA